MRVRPAHLTDRADWLRLRHQLWPDAAGDHEREIDEYFSGKSLFIDQAMVCVDEDECPVGFVELQIRNYAEGSDQSRVPFVEGWYVEAAHRGKGAGKRLMRAAEEWARDKGFFELASDANLHNLDGIRAHKALGFQEVEKIVSFLKKL